MREYIDNEGKKRERVFKNSIKETILTEITPEYKVQLENDVLMFEKEKMKNERKEKIYKKMMQMAEKELEKERKL